jgi:CHAD domain-containing protein
MIDTNSAKSDAAQLLLDGLEKSWQNYCVELKRCRTEFSNEAVHDLRVVTRRMVAVLRLLHSIAPRPRLQKMIRILKEQLDEFDDLRDTQVILAEISETIQELPDLYEFQKRQLRQEDKLLRNARKQVKKFNVKELSRRIRKTHDWLEREAETDLGSEILQAVDDAFLTTQQRLAVVDLARASTIHRLRVAFKTFRYMVEMIHPLLPDFPETCLEYMHAYQARMGEVQDAEVFLQAFHDFAGTSAGSDLEAIDRYYERRHAEAIAAYADDMMQLNNFWRPEPDKPFPWQ